MTLRKLNRDEINRFMSYVEVKDSCWNWLGYIRKNGYGVISFDGKQQYAHRISYFNFEREIPVGKEIDHLCRNRHCVNPKHLEPVTRSVNTSRGMSGELSRIRHSKITHCPHGHEYTLENIYLYHNKRNCKKCRDINNIERKRRSN